MVSFSVCLLVWSSFHLQFHLEVQFSKYITERRAYRIDVAGLTVDRIVQRDEERPRVSFCESLADCFDHKPAFRLL